MKPISRSHGPLKAIADLGILVTAHMFSKHVGPPAEHVYGLMVNFPQ